jgi:hypothetical protein
LTSPRVSPASRHIGGLIPVEQSLRCHKIADLEKAVFELRKFGLGGLAVAFCRASAGLCLADLVHERGSLLLEHDLHKSADFLDKIMRQNKDIETMSDSY